MDSALAFPLEAQQPESGAAGASIRPSVCLCVPRQVAPLVLEVHRRPARLELAPACVQDQLPLVARAAILPHQVLQMNG